MIVVLRAPSLAEQVARHGGLATDTQERKWTAQAYAAQAALISQLGAHGLRMTVEFSYARVLNGFSAALDGRAAALLERSSDVAGVYPVRAAYPAAIATAPATAGASPGASLQGHDGRGVLVALLDTGVDRTQPGLRGHVLAGYDVLDNATTAVAQADPLDPRRVEEHGTEMAGIVVGKGGVAPGVSVLPIRVAGWQLDAQGQPAVYGRSDQLIAGLERAVDPNDDGDAHDGARIALVPLAEPYAAFADSPEARAVVGALRLDTLVVAAAGNDGPAGPAFGSISGPGGAAGALTVGRRRPAAGADGDPRRPAQRSARGLRPARAARRIRRPQAARRGRSRGAAAAVRPGRVQPGRGPRRPPARGLRSRDDRRARGEGGRARGAPPRSNRPGRRDRRRPGDVDVPVASVPAAAWQRGCCAHCAREEPAVGLGRRAADCAERARRTAAPRSRRAGSPSTAA